MYKSVYDSWSQADKKRIIDDNKSLSSKVDELRIELYNANLKIEELNSQKESLNKQRESLNQQREQLKESLNKQRESLNQQREQLKESLNKQRESLNKQSEQLKDNLKDLYKTVKFSEDASIALDAYVNYKQDCETQLKELNDKFSKYKQNIDEQFRKYRSNIYTRCRNIIMLISLVLTCLFGSITLYLYLFK